MHVFNAPLKQLRYRRLPLVLLLTTRLPLLPLPLLPARFFRQLARHLRRHWQLTCSPSVLAAARCGVRVAWMW